MIEKEGKSKYITTELDRNQALAQDKDNVLAH
jgi:hypothetical protein